MFAQIALTILVSTFSFGLFAVVVVICQQIADDFHLWKGKKNGNVS